METANKIVYLDLVRDKRGENMNEWAQLRSAIEARSMPCPVTGCWLWFEGAASKGYGVMRWNGKLRYVTRLSLMAYTGELPEGRFACHRCNVPSCVNPDHLYWGSRENNAQDAVSKGRAGRYPVADTAWGVEGKGDGAKVRQTEITAAYLRSVLHYDPVSGIFRWHERTDVPLRWNIRFAGKRAGSTMASKYRQVTLCGGHYYEHRLAWLYMHGSWPKHQIDHLNNDRSDNRLENLREATNQENGVARDQRKLRSTNKSGVVGVSWSQKPGHKGSWYATITMDGHMKNLGRYENLEDAVMARREAERQYGRAA